MHPLEQLRAVARVDRVSAVELVSLAADALVGFWGNPPELVPALLRLVERHPTCGPVWCLASRVLLAEDPAAAAADLVVELEGDSTADVLAAVAPEGGRVVVVGWPGVASLALAERGDLSVAVVRSAGSDPGLARALARLGNEAEDLPAGAVGAAVVGSDVVVLEAEAAGPDGLVASEGSLAAAAVARAAGVPCWVVVPAGTLLPGPLWLAMRSRLDRSAEGRGVVVRGTESGIGRPGPQCQESGIGDDRRSDRGRRARQPGRAERAGAELVGLGLADEAFRPGARVPPDRLDGLADCADAPELRRGAGLAFGT